MDLIDVSYDIIGFGKYSGETFEDISITDPGYLEWLYHETENENIKIAIEKCIEIT